MNWPVARRGRWRCATAGSARRAAVRAGRSRLRARDIGPCRCSGCAAGLCGPRCRRQASPSASPPWWRSLGSRHRARRNSSRRSTPSARTCSPCPQQRLHRPVDVLAGRAPAMISRIGPVTSDAAAVDLERGSVYRNQDIPAVDSQAITVTAADYEPVDHGAGTPLGRPVPQCRSTARPAGRGPRLTTPRRRRSASTGPTAVSPSGCPTTGSTSSAFWSRYRPGAGARPGARWLASPLQSTCCTGRRHRRRSTCGRTPRAASDAFEPVLYAVTGGPGRRRKRG